MRKKVQEVEGDILTSLPSTYLNYGREGMKSCELHKAISEFYFVEEEYWWKRKYWYDGDCGELKTERYKERLFNIVERIIPFGFAACIGEARYFYKTECVDSLLGLNDSCYEKLYEKAEAAANRILDIIDVSGNSLNVGEMGREQIYRNAVPFNQWLSVLDDLICIFTPKIWRGHGYGGGRWQEGCKALRDVVIAFVRWESTKDLVIATDTFINLCHNGGLLLNKFDDGCGKVNISTLLNAKRVGSAVYLGYVLNLSCKKCICVNKNVWRERKE